MPRVRRGFKARRRRKKWLKLAKGSFGGRHTMYRKARETVMRALSYAYRDRRQRKRQFRRLWIARINAAARLHDLSYSRLMHGLRLANIDLDRKILADIAVHDPKAFGHIAETAKAHLN